MKTKTKINRYLKKNLGKIIIIGSISSIGIAAQLSLIFMPVPVIAENQATQIEQAAKIEPVAPVMVYEVVSETIREVTAYNVGDIFQTDSTPCIGAYSKVNLCEEVAKGKNVCAANFVPLGTELLITAPNGWNFHCIVWDRMASKHSQRVDIAMNLWEKDRAIKFGLQNDC